jgi:hypothetical protein
VLLGVRRLEKGELGFAVLPHSHKDSHDPKKLPVSFYRYPKIGKKSINGRFLSMQMEFGRQLSPERCILSGR